MLSAGMLPTLYPPLPGHHPHPAMAMGRGPMTTDLALAGYQHIQSSDPGLANRLSSTDPAHLPDIVHSHSVGHGLQPRPNQHRSGSGAAAAASRHQRQRQQQSRGQGRSRNTSSRDNGNRSGQHRRRSRTQSATSTTATENNSRCKEPCVKCMVTVTSLRWVLLLLSMLGVLFVVSGIVMAALHAVGNDFLIYALVFIGLGVVLVAVVVVAWKCTPPGSEPIHALFNIGDSRSNRRDRRHRRPHRQRNNEWHGGMMYPEFQYRRPPPSYAASMQAYQAQMAAEAQSNNNVLTVGNNNDNYSLPGSPPPSYRSRASTIHSGVHITFPPGHDSAPNSRPPTYRSRAESHPRPRLPMDDAEPASPSTAPADVSFIGPAMTAETVQQIIGTSRNHRRQQSAGASVFHTRASSLDLGHGPEVSGHRRGASLDHSNISIVLSSSSQEFNPTPPPPNQITVTVPRTPSKRLAPLPSASSIEDSGQLSEAAALPNTQEPSKENMKQQTAGASVRQTAKEDQYRRTRGLEVDTDSIQTHTVSVDTDSEPEHYITPL